MSLRKATRLTLTNHYAFTLSLLRKYKQATAPSVSGKSYITFGIFVYTVIYLPSIRHTVIY
jgi:hypothetical protein